MPPVDGLFGSHEFDLLDEFFLAQALALTARSLPSSLQAPYEL
jgi:hypothetical protein